jgi:hypothetical protein
MSRDRSRSRDNDDHRPIWGNPDLDRPHDPTRTRCWNYMPALSRIRRVLICVDITQIRRLMEEQFPDAMTVTSCTNLPDLRDPQEMAMFTYARLLKPSQLQTTTVGDLLAGISQYIDNTWGVNTDADIMDLRWSDRTGDTFALRNPRTISRLLQENRPNWAQAQDIGIFGSLIPVTCPTQPYITRMSCHKALPPNYPVSARL